LSRNEVFLGQKESALAVVIVIVSWRRLGRDQPNDNLVSAAARFSFFLSFFLSFSLSLSLSISLSLSLPLSLPISLPLSLSLSLSYFFRISAQGATIDYLWGNRPTDDLVSAAAGFSFSLFLYFSLSPSSLAFSESQLAATTISFLLLFLHTVRSLSLSLKR
jgi:hypothetical protein